MLIQMGCGDDHDALTHVMVGANTFHRIAAPSKRGQAAGGRERRRQPAPGHTNNFSADIHSLICTAGPGACSAPSPHAHPTIPTATVRRQSNKIGQRSGP